MLLPNAAKAALVVTVPPAGQVIVVADDLGNAYVCDPQHGRLLVVHDPYPPQSQPQK